MSKILPLIIVIALIFGGVFWYSQKGTTKQSTGQVESNPQSVSEISWEKDSSSRVTDGSVPFVHKLKDGKIRLYYCSSGGILSAISSDGLSFTKEEGIRISPGTGFELQVCDPTIVNLPDGKMRMYYKGASSLNPGPGQ